MAISTYKYGQAQMHSNVASCKFSCRNGTPFNTRRGSDLYMDRALAPRSQGQSGNPYPPMDAGPFGRGTQARSTGNTQSRSKGPIQESGWSQMPESMPQDLAAEIDQALQNRR
jgi:hypothetical protein